MGGFVKPNQYFMGDFKIVIDGVGGHGQDREKKHGEIVNFNKDNYRKRE
ncbi:MAG TPA: hypothetical protein VG847_06125 [Chitinophagaceae bacterium]|nr:hypothetical protein [Chitinophagaceae bacterium]